MNRASSPKALSLLAFALSLIAAPTAFAEPAPEMSAAAQAAFDDAMKLMKQGRAAEACPKFEAVQRLDGGTGNLFRLAECYEKVGRLASAWATYREAASAARVSKRADREDVARKRATAIEPSLSRMTITVPPALAALPGLEIKRDGDVVEKSLWGTAVPVDPGEHLVVASAPGKKDWQGKGVAAAQPTKLEVTIAPLENRPPEPVAPPSDSSREEVNPETRSRVPAVVMGVGALVAVGAGAGLFVASQGKRVETLNFADIVAKTGTCLGATPDKRCSQIDSMARQVDTFQNIAVGAFIGAGVLAVGTLTYLLLPPPKVKKTMIQGGALHVTPFLGADQGGMVVSGAF